MYSYDTEQATPTTPTGTAAELDPAVRRILLSSGISEDELAQLGTSDWFQNVMQKHQEDNPNLAPQYHYDGRDPYGDAGMQGPRVKGGLLSAREMILPTEDGMYHYDGADAGGAAVKRIRFSDIDSLNREKAGIGGIDPDFRPSVALDYDPQTGKLLGSDINWYSQKAENEANSFEGSMREILPIVLTAAGVPLGEWAAGAIGSAIGTTVPNWVGSAAISGGSSLLQGGDLGDVLKSAAGSAAAGYAAPEINKIIGFDPKTDWFNPGKAIASGGLNLIKGGDPLEAALSAAGAGAGAPIGMLSPILRKSSTGSTRRADTGASSADLDLRRKYAEYLASKGK